MKIRVNKRLASVRALRSKVHRWVDSLITPEKPTVIDLAIALGGAVCDFKLWKEEERLKRQRVKKHNEHYLNRTR
jgi:hypothetical protein